MNVRDVEALRNWLDRIDSLPSYQRDLIDDAIYNLEHGNDYRAEQSLKTMARNYRNDGDSNAADAVERLAREHVCTSHNKKGLEDFGYGNGWSYFYEAYAKLLMELDRLRDVGINVIVICHAALRRVDLPNEDGSFVVKFGNITIQSSEIDDAMSKAFERLQNR